MLVDRLPCPLVRTHLSVKEKRPSVWLNACLLLPLIYPGWCDNHAYILNEELFYETQSTKEYHFLDLGHPCGPRRGGLCRAPVRQEYFIFAACRFSFGPGWIRPPLPGVDGQRSLSFFRIV